MGEVYVQVPSLEKQGYIPARYVVSIIYCLGLTVNAIMRVSINLAIVAMVKTENPDTNSTVVKNVCGFEKRNNTMESYVGQFEWDEWRQSLVLSSFFWGYVVGQIPGGRLAEVYGAKLVFGTSMVLASFLSFTMPYAAKYHYVALIFTRVLMGIITSPCYPAAHVLMSNWAPPVENAIMVAIAYNGGQAGTIIGYPLAALIIFNFGWEAVFYIQGLITLVWCTLWFVTISNKPENFTWITQTEKDYILKSIGDTKDRDKGLPVPWKRILLSSRVWAINFASFGHSWGFFTLVTDLPLYMKTMLLVDINMNAILNSIPYMLQIISNILIALLAGLLLRRGNLKRITIRKMVNSFTQLSPAICLLCLQLVECNKVGTIVFLFLTVILNGGAVSGFSVNIIDIAPNFAGTVHGLSNAFGSLPGFLAPMTVGALVNNEPTFENWRKVFWITSGTYVFCATIYALFASGKEQKWNRKT